MNPQSVLSTVGVCLLVYYVVDGLRSLRRDRKIALLEAKIDTLYRKTGMTFDRLEAVEPHIREALQAGQMIVAIKLYREATHSGLRASKLAVESMMRGERQPPATHRPLNDA